jgi:hypothetical protein
MVNGKFERMWEEAVVARIKAISRNLPCGSSGKPQNTLVRIAGVRAEILTQDLPNTKQEC